MPIDEKCGIFLAGKGFCWAPSQAWGCSDAELCGKCQVKQSEKTAPLQSDVMPDVKHRCANCGGKCYKERSRCSICLQAPAKPAIVYEVRTCRFCRTENVHFRQWRKKDRMCSKAKCWSEFLKELKFAV